MDKHHRLFKGACPLSIINKGLVIIESKPHSANNHNVCICLIRNPHQKGVIRLACNREDRNFLRFDKAIKDIDHRNIGAHKLMRNSPSHRIERGSMNVGAISTNGWSIVYGIASTAKTTS